MLLVLQLFLIVFIILGGAYAGLLLEQFHNHFGTQIVLGIVTALMFAFSSTFPIMFFGVRWTLACYIAPFVLGFALPFSLPVVHGVSVII